MTPKNSNEVLHGTQSRNSRLGEQGDGLDSLSRDTRKQGLRLSDAADSGREGAVVGELSTAAEADREARHGGGCEVPPSSGVTPHDPSGDGHPQSDLAAAHKVESQTKLVPVLRTCVADMTSYDGFQWKREGRVAAPDWRKTASCGRGLHGLLRGDGDGSLLSWAADAVWMVVMVDESLCVNLSGKVKFPWADVVFCGDKLGAAAKLTELGCDPAKIVGATLTGGDGATLTIRYWNGKKYRVAVFEVGEDGIEPDVPYRSDESGKPVKAVSK